MFKLIKLSLFIFFLSFAVNKDFQKKELLGR